MAQALETRPDVRAVSARSPGIGSRPAFQAYLILYVGFIVLFIMAGLDKFFHRLVNWDLYLAPQISNTLHVVPHNFMLVVGVIEIVAGFLVAIRSQIGAWFVTLWLWAIVVNLLMIQGYDDIALSDFCLSLGALALARLSQEFGRRIKA